MKTGDTIVRNTFWYGVVTAIGVLAGFIMSVVLARGLGPARMGDYSYLLWALRTMTALATLGYALGTVRYTADALAQDRSALAFAFVRLFVRRQVLATAVVALGLAPVVLWLAPADFRWPLVVMLLGLFPITLESIYTHAAYGAQRYDVTTQVSAVKMTLQLATAVLVVSLGGDILGLMIGGVLGVVVSCALQRRSALALYPKQAAAIPADIRVEMRAYLLPLAIVAVLDSLVWDRSEIFFLRLYAPSAQIAFYSLAFGLASRAMLAPQIAVGALLPALASIHGRGDHAEFSGVYRSALRAVALIGTPIVVVATALAPGLIPLLYGAPYGPVALLMGPMLAVSLIAVMRQVAWSALRATGDRRWGLHATLVAAAIDIGAAVVLIPRWGMWGAVLANAAAQLLASIVAFVGVAVRCRCRFPALDVVRVAAAAAVGFAVTQTAAGHEVDLLPLAAAGMAGALAFLTAAGLLGAVGAREWALISRPLGGLPRWARLGAVAVVVITAAAGLWTPLALRLTRLWWVDSYYSYGVLVPLFSAWVLWEGRHRLRPARPVWDDRGLVVLGCGVALFALGEATQSLTLSALSVPAVLAGLAVFILGAGARPLAFPIGFLAFMAPLPDGVIPAISLPLQRLAAGFAAQTLAFAGIPLVHRDLDIYLPRITLEVTEGCNGLRFLLAMIVLGTAFAWATQTRLLRRGAVLAFAVLIALLANLVRVAGTGFLAHYWGPAAATGFFHIAYGKVVYLAMLVPFVLGVLLLRRWRRLTAVDHGA